MAKSKADTGRTLPKKQNPLLNPSETPEHSELINSRRLGRTNLHVKAAQVGTSSATAPENLGTIEYAYLGAPLPKNLKGSEVFKSHAAEPTPPEYFMMRRSKDGFVSATGMFKVAFPWAKEAEERSERDYLQTLETTSTDEQAGNIWINEGAALDLAEEYGIRRWVEALLDPALPVTDPNKQTGGPISPPPKFEFKAGGTNGRISASPSLGPPASPARVKKSKRADSPTKGSASPRKRLTKAEKEARAKAAKAASESLQNALDTAASVADSESVAGTEIEGPKLNGNASPASPKPRKKSEKKSKAKVKAKDDDEDPTKDEEKIMDEDYVPTDDDEDKVTVQVESTVEKQGDVERTHTNVRVQMPADSPELPLPESTEEMIAEAKRMVEEARKLEGEESASKKSKRKAEHIEEEDDEIAVEAAQAKAEGRELQPAKKARLMEQQVRTQKVRSRALMGLAATLTIGAIAPYFLG